MVFDPANSQLPVPSPNAKPLPSHLARKSQTTSQDPQNDKPKADEPFCDPKSPHVWSEFHTAKLSRNPNQVKIDLWKPKQLWYYLGKTSTEAKAQYTEDLRKPRNNLDANFLESVRPHAPIVPPMPRQSYPASYPSGVNMHAVNGAMVQARQRQLQQPQQPQQPQPQLQRSPPQPQLQQSQQPQQQHRPQQVQQSMQQQQRSEKPYTYKPRIHDGYTVDPQALMSQRAFQQGAAMKPPQRQNSYEGFRAPQAPMGSMSAMSPRTPMAPTAPMTPMTPMAPTMAGNHQRSPSYMKDFDDYQRVRLNAHKHGVLPCSWQLADNFSGDRNQIADVGKSSNNSNIPNQHPEPLSQT